MSEPDATGRRSRGQRKRNAAPLQAQRRPWKEAEVKTTETLDVPYPDAAIICAMAHAGVRSCSPGCSCVRVYELR